MLPIRPTAATYHLQKVLVITRLAADADKAVNLEAEVGAAGVVFVHGQQTAVPLGYDHSLSQNVTILSNTVIGYFELLADIAHTHFIGWEDPDHLTTKNEFGKNQSTQYKD